MNKYTVVIFDDQAEINMNTYQVEAKDQQDAFFVAMADDQGVSYDEATQLALDVVFWHCVFEGHPKQLV